MIQFIRNRADCLQDGIYLAVLAFVPDFAVPVAFFDQAAPQDGIKVPVVPTRAKYLRIFAQDFIARVAGNGGKGIINVNNFARCGGDHDALARMPVNTRGQLKFCFGLLTLL